MGSGPWDSVLEDFVDPTTPDIHPTFAPRNALGLYVFRGAASFRWVVVEPLADGK
jgi:hypothetical protein